jgi:type VI secretion system secreted protein Hcp
MIYPANTFLIPMKSALLLIAVLGVAMFAGMTPNAFAAVDMYLKIDGIKGESQDDRHKDQIDVLAWSWGMSNSGTTHEGGGGGAGKASIQDFSFTKFIDTSTTDFMLRTLNGEHIPKVELIVEKPSGGEPFEFLRITFENVLVTSVSTGGSGGEDRLTENVSLNFQKVKVEYTQQKQDGSKGETKTISWDIAANAPV